MSSALPMPNCGTDDPAIVEAHHKLWAAVIRQAFADYPRWREDWTRDHPEMRLPREYFYGSDFEFICLIVGLDPAAVRLAGFKVRKSRSSSYPTERAVKTDGYSASQGAATEGCRQLSNADLARKDDAKRGSGSQTDGPNNDEQDHGSLLGAPVLSGGPIADLD